MRYVKRPDLTIFQTKIFKNSKVGVRLLHLLHCSGAYVHTHVPTYTNE